MAKSPDYKGKLTIYTTTFEPVGEIVMYEDHSPEPKHPKYYGQIILNKTVITANFGLWKNEESNPQDTKCPQCGANKQPKFRLCYNCNLKQKEAKPQ